MVGREQIVRMGADGRLFGLLTDAGGGEVGCIFLNAGIVHRIGPHRLHVRLARALAPNGVTSLRFDISGLGDSPPPHPGVCRDEQIARDVGDAIEALETAGCTRIVLAGMCSGADTAFGLSCEDERVHGCVLLDPWAYGTVLARVERLARKTADPGRWARRLQGLGRSHEAATETMARPREVDDPNSNERVAPPREVFGAGLSALTGRGGRVFIAYTDFVSEIMQRPEHFHRAFADYAFHDRLEVHVNTEADHTYTDLRQQQLLEAQVTNWFARQLVEGGRG
jgi:pimeloyl-ACP methyl ester carboxylesterase